MLLGDVIARFEDDGFVLDTLLSLDDLALMTCLVSLADRNGVSIGELAQQALNTFVREAGDEEWLGLIGMMSRTDNPGQAFLRRVLSNALAQRSKFNGATHRSCNSEVPPTEEHSRGALSLAPRMF